MDAAPDHARVPLNKVLRYIESCMKAKLSIGILAVIVAAGIYFFLVPRESAGPAHTEPATVAPPPGATTADSGGEEQADALKQKQMETAYAQLERNRELLKRRLGLVRTDVWGLKLPAAQARSIENKMLNGYELLKHPPMLGAFSSVDEIEQEQARVQGALDDLDSIERDLKTGKQ